MKTLNPKCSHCDYELTHDELWSDTNISKLGDEDSDITCPNCRNVFHVQCVNEIAFYQTDKDGEEIN
jgi:DNA-directed RNA polymerase subunit RPC12/RpoP